MEPFHNSRPSIAIVETNTLAVIGLKHILEDIMPMIVVDSYGTFSELEANHPDSYFHYFVNVGIVLANREFFTRCRYKTIVLIPSSDNDAYLEGFHNICICQPEKHLIKSLLLLEQHAHAHGRNLPSVIETHKRSILSIRETEVLSLVVKGLINKEIADSLNIRMSTVVTHRKNLMNKLGMKSVSALTIYAVMHGYVDINDI